MFRRGRSGRDSTRLTSTHASVVRRGAGVLGARRPEMESLEFRHLLAGVSVVNQLAPSYDLFVLGDRFREETRAACDQEDRVYADLTRLPAPVAADFNLDGDFTTDDFITYFQDASLQEVFGRDDSSQLNEAFDIAASIQLAPYEIKSRLTGPPECMLLDLVRTTPASDVYQESSMRADGLTPASLLTSMGAYSTVRFVSDVQFDQAGFVQTAALEVYLPNSAQLYSRSLSEYGKDGSLANYSTWVYSESGELRRRTTTTWNSIDAKDVQVTDARYFSEGQQEVLRLIHHQAAGGVELSRQTFRYEDGEPTSMVLEMYGDPASVTTRFENVDSFLPQDEDLADAPGLPYLVDLELAYRATVDLLRPHYEPILRMNEPRAFSQLEALIQTAHVTDSEATRFRNLKSYFQLSVELTDALRRNDLSTVYQRFGNLIDLSTGHWAPWFSEFMRTERLAIPLEPLRLFNLSDNSSTSEQQRLVELYTKTVGENPAAYFQQLQISPQTNARSVLESMRRAKVQIRLLELEADGGVPTFDWIAVPDKPEMEVYGIQPIVPLTGWYFFERDEAGNYDRNQISISVMRKRFSETELDEDAFYVMNLEDWPLDGTPEETAESLRKLKQAANHIHYFNPNLMIGFYRLMPVRDVTSAVGGRGDEGYAEWQRTNSRIAAALEDTVDLLFPSLYILHLGDADATTEERWSHYATENLREARRIADGKPLLAFIALYYHPNGGDANETRPNPKGWQWVEPELIAYQLLRLRELVDGHVLYNDLRTTWAELTDSGTVAALELLTQVRTLGMEAEFLSYYEELLVTHRDELVQKVELETRIYELEREQREANQQGHVRLAVRLGQDRAVAKTQLESAISLWPSLRSFVQDRVELH